MLQPRLVSVEPVFPLKLRLAYETGEVRMFDVANCGTRTLFRRYACCRTVRESNGATDRTSRRMSCMKTA